MTGSEIREAQATTTANLQWALANGRDDLADVYTSQLATLQRETDRLIARIRERDGRGTTLHVQGRSFAEMAAMMASARRMQAELEYDPTVIPMAS